MDAAGNTRKTELTFDKFGRTITIRSLDPNPNGDVFRNIVYDGKGRRKQVSEPYRTGSPLWTTTTFDALWMGVPVVTLVGQTIVGRAGLSQLINLSLPELIARTPDEYVQIAAGLASDLARLSQLRGSLRQRMQSSPLMDAPRFARSIEAAYRTMWQRWCAASGGAAA